VSPHDVQTSRTWSWPRWCGIDATRRVRNGVSSLPSSRPKSPWWMGVRFQD
jgi:hypothetical protein